MHDGQLKRVIRMMIVMMMRWWRTKVGIRLNVSCIAFVTVYKTGGIRNTCVTEIKQM